MRTVNTMAPPSSLSNPKAVPHASLSKRRDNVCDNAREEDTKSCLILYNGNVGRRKYFHFDNVSTEMPMQEIMRIVGNALARRDKDCNILTIK